MCWKLIWMNIFLRLGEAMTEIWQKLVLLKLNVLFLRKISNLHKILYNSLKTDTDLTVDIEFESDRLKEQYFDKYDGIYTEISQATRFDESTDLSTTYLGKMDTTRGMMIKAEEKFPISRQRYTTGKLLDN